MRGANACVCVCEAGRQWLCVAGVRLWFLGARTQCVAVCVRQATANGAARRNRQVCHLIALPRTRKYTCVSISSDIHPK